jgi:hypothetical protein
VTESQRLRTEYERLDQVVPALRNPKEHATSAVRWGGEGGTAALRRLGHLGLHYRYATPDQAPLAVALAASQSHHLHRNWRRIMADRAEALGATAYPERADGEGEWR